jgi:hypothetical protein
LSLTDAFICAQGTIIVDIVADLITIYQTGENKGGANTLRIEKFTEDYAQLLNFADEFATGDPCALEKSAATYFPHILFLSSFPSPKGLSFLIHTWKGKCATLTPRQLNDFMDIWNKRDGQFSSEGDIYEYVIKEVGIQAFGGNRLNMNLLMSHMECSKKGTLGKQSLQQQKEVQSIEKIEI